VEDRLRKRSTVRDQRRLRGLFRESTSSLAPVHAGSAGQQLFHAPKQFRHSAVITCHGTRPGRFTAPVTLFSVSLVLGLLTPYDYVRAWEKFVLISTGLAVGLLLFRLPSVASWGTRELRPVSLVLGGVPLSLAVFFFFANDWNQPAEKLLVLEPVRSWLASWQPVLPLPRFHPNVAAGVLAMMVPLQVAAVGGASGLWWGSTRASSLAKTALLAASGAALLVSGLRGAWLALAGATGLWFMWRWAQRGPTRKRSGIRLAVVAFCVFGAALTWALMPSLTAIAMSRADRLLVWQHSWELAWDYFFTGLGLGNFAMAYSSYALLVHVPHTTHAHNLFLDIWLEQGLLGLIGFCWLAAVALLTGLSRHSRDSQPNAGQFRWHDAAFISLTVALLHGLIDDVMYGYEGVGSAFLFVPIGLLARDERKVERGAVRSTWRHGLLMWGFAVTFLVAAVWAPPVRSLYRANLGALLQTRAELSRYQWPRWPVQDALRRAKPEELTSAIGHYQSALSDNLGNAVANRRLGQIELSLGDYGAARDHLSRAHRAAPRHLAARQLYGESLAVTGDRELAVELWRSLALEEDQLEIRRQWYRSISEHERAERIDDAMSLRRMPGG